MHSKSLSIVVPVYNEEETLAYTIQRLLTVARALPCQTEIIFVNDGSADHSQAILQDWLAKTRDEKVQLRSILLSRNFGHASAVLAGLEKAQSDLIAIIDADLQDPPELLADMIAQLETEHVDVVYGKRIKRQGESWFKRFTAWLFYIVIGKLTAVKIPRDTGDFRVITRQVRDAVLFCKEHDPFIRGIVAWVGFKQKEFPYVRESRQHGTTKYPLKKMIKFAMLAIISFSAKPMLISFYIGLFGMLLSMSLGLWALFGVLFGHTVPGWASLLAGFSLVQSIIFLLLGVQGLYLARVHEESINRPRFIIKQSINF